MNRYSVDFNDVDPETGRPFSWGHPDGVWMISIVYCLIALVSVGAAIFGIYKIKSGSDGGYVMALSAIVTTLIFVLPVHFLFKRSTRAIHLTCLIALLAFLSSAAFLSGFMDKYVLLGDAKYLLLGATGLQIYVFIYVVGLEKDRLLS